MTFMPFSTSRWRGSRNEINARMKWMLDLDNPALDWVSISTGLGVGNAGDNGGRVS